MTRVPCILLLLFCGVSAAEVENDSVSLVQKRTEVLALEDASADDDDLDADYSDEDDVVDLDHDKDLSDDDDLDDDEDDDLDDGLAADDSDEDDDADLTEDEDLSDDGVACKKKCARQYNKFVKKGKEGVGWKKVCAKSICEECSFCAEEFPTPAPSAPCRKSCGKSFDKFKAKGKEAVGQAKLCNKRRCSGCSFCAEEFPTPAPSAPCRKSCGKKFDKFKAKGKEDRGRAKLCDKRRCSGCAFCSEDPAPAPAPEELPVQAPAPAPEPPTPAPTSAPPDPYAPFKGWLDGQNGAETGIYTFRLVKATGYTASDNYDEVMVKECAKVGLKPLCDHRTFCKDDPKSVFMGNYYHVANDKDRDAPVLVHASSFPKGWAELKGKFPQDFCAYTSTVNGHGKSCYCTIGGDSYWKRVDEFSEFLCAAVSYEPDPPFQGELGSMNGARGGLYKFQRVRTSDTGGNFDQIMIKECAKVNMKPLCDHPDYCRYDSNSVYMGQSDHISQGEFFGDRYDPKFPSGWADLKAKFPKTYCTYTGQHGSPQKSFCTVGYDRSWQAPAPGYQDIMCAASP